jgi:hypothetical protein
VVADVSVQAIEADLDDESGRVQLTFEASLMVEGDAASPAFGYVRVEDVAYQVTIHGTAAA